MELSGGSSSVPRQNVPCSRELGAASALRNHYKVIRLGTGRTGFGIRRPGHARAGVRPRSPGAPVWQNGRVSSLRRSFLVALMLGLAFGASACGSAAPSVRPTPSAPSTSPSASISATGSDQAVYAEIESQVEAIRQLRPSTAVTPVLLDSAGVRAWLTKANAAETDHQALADESRLFIHLGLLPAGSSLEQMELDLQSGQVIGFYDPVSKGLYVLSESGGVGPIEKLTFSHEYTHALQDQNFGLDKLGNDAPDQGDRDLARTALPEGDATLVMTLWAQKYMSLGELLGIAADPLSGVSSAQLAGAPAILRQTLLFPYESGLAFVQAIYVEGGWAAVDKLYANPPDSTSQILHPQLYTDGVEPIAVTVPAVPASLGSGWKLTMQDTLGELQLRIWLEGENPSTAATTAATAATSDWGGDRVGLYEGPNGAWAVVLHTVWRSAAGGAAFSTAASQTLTAVGAPSRACGGSTGVNIVIASNVSLVPEFIDCNQVS